MWICWSDPIQWSVPLRIPTVMSSLFDPAAHSDGCPSQIGNQQKTKTLVQRDEEKGVCRFTKTNTKTNTNTGTKTKTEQTDCRKPTLLCRMTRTKKEDFQFSRIEAIRILKEAGQTDRSKINSLDYWMSAAILCLWMFYSSAYLIRVSSPHLQIKSKISF